MGASVISFRTRIQTVELEGKNWKFLGGLYYPENTPDSLVLLLDRAHKNEWVLVFDYGDLQTGVSYSENISTMGKIVESKEDGSAKLSTFFNTVPIRFGSILRVMSTAGDDLYTTGNYKRLYDWTTAQIRLSHDLSLIRTPFEILAYKADSHTGEFFMNEKIVVHRAESYAQANEFLDRKRKYEHC